MTLTTHLYRTSGSVRGRGRGSVRGRVRVSDSVRLRVRLGLVVV